MAVSLTYTTVELESARRKGGLDKDLYLLLGGSILLSQFLTIGWVDERNRTTCVAGRLDSVGNLRGRDNCETKPALIEHPVAVVP